jgi:hypothetical protein
VIVSVPRIEISDYPDVASVGGPDGEVNAGDTIHLDDMRAQLPIEVPVASLADEM